MRAQGAGTRDELTTSDKVLATALYLRQLGIRDILAQLFGVNTSILTRVVHQVQPLLTGHSCTIPPSTARFRTPTDVTAFLDNSNPTKIKPTC
ncbi:transposase family protein [Streptomyces apricus]|uniref:Transposase family protein n=1 Tax=Streptomyces apricus TaxID=1828112 RepID=A0A5A9ZW32_9ACTN|nr:transposase family protein [Streptomyces apricus]